jgi:16S rRNA (adenine1518-N6/adenine1519-N6)-dimethyltransferase
MPRQKLGQHFLSSLTWRQRIAQTLPVAPDSTWIEIGAGHGEMTELVAPRAHRVIAIETDPALASYLRERFAQTSNVEIIESDILSIDIATIASTPPASDFRQGTVSTVPKSGRVTWALAPEESLAAHAAIARPIAGERFRVYGNLPYYITSPILTHLFRFAAQIESIHIVIQWEVAQRIAATPGHREYAYLSALCQYFARPEIVLRIPPGAFRPPPKVNSALVAMALPGERAKLHIANDQSFLEFLQHSFAQKRKTLRNNLKSLFANEQIANALAACKLTANSRAEELSLGQFAKLFHLLAADR